MKVLKHIIRGIIWTILGLYIFTISLIQIPAIKNGLGSQVASLLSEKLGTKVQIGRIDLGFFNRLIIDDVVIYDQHKKEMIKSARLSVKIDLVSLLENRISISSAQMFGTDFTLYRTSVKDAPNYQFLIDSLSSKDDDSNKSPLDLRVNTFIMQHCSFKYDRYDVAPTNSKLNPNHLKISDISAHISIKALKDDSLNVIVKKLAFVEQSGLRTDKISLKLEGNRSGCKLQDFKLNMPGTDIRIDNISATYKFDGNDIIKSSLRYKGSIDCRKIGLSDFAFIIPSVKPLRNTLNMRSEFHGTYSKFQIDKFKAGSSADGLNVELYGTISDWNRTVPGVSATVKDISVSPEFIESVFANLNEEGNVPGVIARLGNINLHGGINSESGTLNARGIIETGIGKIEIGGTFSEDKTVSGNIVTKDLNLGKMLDNSKFGLLATSIGVHGLLKGGEQNVLDVKSNVSQFEFNGYRYGNIIIDALLKNRQLSGKLTVDDANGSLAVEGALRKTIQNKSDVELTASIRNFSPAATRLSNKWGDSVFDTDIAAKLKVGSINDIIGVLSLTDFSMRSSSDEYSLKKLELNSDADNTGERHILLTGDIGMAELCGRFDYNTIGKSIMNIIKKRLPTIPGLSAETRTTKNSFRIEACLSNSDWLEKLFNVPLHLTDTLMLKSMVDDQKKEIFVNCEVPHFLYSGKEYTDGKIVVVSDEDTLHSEVGVTKTMDNGHLLKLTATGDAANNNLQTSFSWDNNNKKRISGRLNAVTQFGGGNGDAATAQITVLPSHININNATWNIEPSVITYSKENVNVDRFAVTNDNQHIIIDGIASKDPDDSLSIDLRDIDVEYILDIVNFHSVDFSGRATGKAYISSPFSKLSAHGNIIVDDFKFENGRMGSLNANVEWDNVEKQININAVSTDGPEVMTCINGYVSPSRNYIDLGISAVGTYLDFMNSFTSSFISRINGQANGEVRLIGPLSSINLVGELVVNADAHVKSTNCKYYMRNDTVRFVPDEIELHDIHIYDVDNNVGIMSGAIHHKHLTKLSYDLFVRADELLAYDFRDFGDDTFYGTVYATGNVGIHGRSGELNIDVSLTPRKKSTFVYNASNPDAISKQEFINWNDVTSAVSEQTVTGKKHRAASLDNIATDTYINFLINCTPDATIKILMDNRTNDYITLNGNGVIRASYYNKGSFNMFGTYVVERGTYDITIQDIIKKNFTFNQGGTIVFGGDPYNAGLNLQAIYTVNGVSLSDLNIGNSFANNTIRVNCLMNIGGQPMAPVVDFDIDMPTLSSDEKQMIRSIINSEDEMNQQVLYLLGIGRFYPQESNNSSTVGNNQPSQTSLAMQSLLSGTISSQLNSMLNTVINNNNWNFGANISPGDEGWNNAEYEGQLSGRLLNNRLLINGQFGYRDNQKNASTNFIGDFDIRYLLFPNGDLSINIYNKTNDRYFTKSSLNTQGIGLMMKKDFRTLRDLFSVPKKKKRKSKAKSD